MSCQTSTWLEKLPELNLGGMKTIAEQNVTNSLNRKSVICNLHNLLYFYLFIFVTQ